MSRDAGALTVQQVCARLGINPKAFYVLVRNGKLRSFNVSAGAQRPRWRVTSAEVDRFIKQKTARGPSV